jgi:hypothetical protein
LRLFLQAPGQKGSGLLIAAGRYGVGRADFAVARAVPKPIREVEIVALLILLALIVALFIGLGFVIKWLFIVAVVAALVWVITFFTRGAA